MSIISTPTPGANIPVPPGQTEPSGALDPRAVGFGKGPKPAGMLPAPPKGPPPIPTGAPTVADSVPVPPELAEARRRHAELGGHFRDLQFAKASDADTIRDASVAYTESSKTLARLEEKFKLDTLARAQAKEPLPKGAETWAQPINFFDDIQAPAFDGSEFPPALAAYPLQFSQHNGFDPSIALLSALGVCAAAIDDRIQITPYRESDHFEQPRLWISIIGASGAGKSPAQNAMLKPLHEIQTETHKQWKREIAALPPDTPSDDRPKRPRIVISDTTIEALAKALSEDVNERGVLLATDELTAWFGSMDQYKSGGNGGRDRSEWLRAFDGGPHSVERVRDDGSVLIPNWGVSILTATTPAALQKISKFLHDDGLMQRFLVGFVDYQTLSPSDSISPAAKAQLVVERERYRQLIGALRKLLPGTANGVVFMSADALKRFDAWRLKNQAEQRLFEKAHPGLAAHIAKGTKFVMRLAITYHCVEAVGLERVGAGVICDPARTSVSLATMERAIAFLDRSFPHSLALYLSHAASPGVFLARELAGFVLSKSTQSLVERREMERGCSAFHKADDGLKGVALRMLESADWIRASESGYRKELPTRFEINPRLRQAFADLAVRENERRRAVKEKIAIAVKHRREDRAKGIV
jgi:Protein of unknown function (DUF3987)